ncbi:tape measure protein [Heliobacterium chlorum]|uniref:Tape measure protein n=1 Tax=Heliobacterium chlorum TaxID=2698 RepID=A0ABR7T728_HELCL|nr:tape measure protein [Heliobacterium chlorum]MBC9785501.1 tape measure protein [Heliobacterium chlorum]
MSALSSVLVKFTADISDFNSKMQSAMGQVQKTGKQMQQDGFTMGGAFTSLKNLALPALGAIAATLGGLSISKGLSFNADLEQAAISFETLLGSAEKAKAMIKDLQQFGATTPFEFPGLQKSAKLMLAMGFNADSVMPNLQAIGDAVSAIGGGEDVLNGVTMALGQMATKGKVSAEEMNQLAERGIPAWDLMAEKLGMSKQQLMELSSQGKIMADQAVPALIEAMGTKFSGAMQKQSQTFTGMLSTLKDNTNMLLGQVLQPVSERLKALMPIAIEFVDKLSTGFKTDGLKGAIEAAFPPTVAIILNGIITGVSTLFSLLQNNWSIIGPILVGIATGFAAFSAIQGIMAGVSVTMATFASITAALATPVGIAAAAIGALVVTGIYLYENWEEITQRLTDCWNGIKSIASSIWEAITKVINDFCADISNTVLLLIGGNLGDIWDQSMQRISTSTHSTLNSVKEWFSQIMDSIANRADLAWTAIGQIWDETCTRIKMSTGDSLSWIKNTITSDTEILQNIWDAAAKNLGVITQELWKLILQYFKNAPMLLAAAMKVIYDVLHQKWMDMKNDAYSMGQNLVRGFVEGMRALGSWLYSSVSSLFTGAVNAAKRALDIRSPSRVMMQLGEYTAQGFAIGMDSREMTVQKSAISLADTAISGVSGYRPTVSTLELAGTGAGHTFNISIQGSNAQEIWEQFERQLARRGVKW